MPPPTNSAIWGRRAPTCGMRPANALVNPKYPANNAMVVRLASCYGLRQVWFNGNRVSLAYSEPLEQQADLCYNSLRRWPTTIELTPDQSAVLAQIGEKPTRVIDPATNASFILLDEQAYQRIKDLLAARDDPEALYCRIAQISPEDWEDPASYE